MTLPTQNIRNQKPTAHWYLIDGKIVKKTRKLRYLVRNYTDKASSAIPGK